MDAKFYQSRRAPGGFLISQKAPQVDAFAADDSCLAMSERIPKNAYGDPRWLSMSEGSMLDGLYTAHGDDLGAATLGAVAGLEPWAG